MAFSLSLYGHTGGEYMHVSLKCLFDAKSVGQCSLEERAQKWFISGSQLRVQSMSNVGCVRNTQTV